MVSDEALKLAHLASNRDEHKIAEKHEVVRNIIFKAGQPRMWFTSAGKMLQWESPGTTRAQELAEIYRMLEIDEEVEGDDRVPGLAALKAKVRIINQICIRFPTYYDSYVNMYSTNQSCSKLSYSITRLESKLIQLLNT